MIRYQETQTRSNHLDPTSRPFPRRACKVPRQFFIVSLTTVSNWSGRKCSSPSPIFLTYSLSEFFKINWVFGLVYFDLRLIGIHLSGISPFHLNDVIASPPSKCQQKPEQSSTALCPSSSGYCSITTIDYPPNILHVAT